MANEVDTNEVDTNEVDTNEVDTNEVDTSEVGPNKLPSLSTIIKMLTIETIISTNEENINGLLIPRELLLDDEKYDKIKIKIPDLKQIFSSSYMTSLQSQAETHQRWPLLNLIRQILRVYQYKLVPKRICDGYTSDGKKKYKRMFIVEKNALK